MEPAEDALRRLELLEFEARRHPAMGPGTKEGSVIELGRDKGKTKEEPTPLPFIVGTTLPVVPAKLVREILSGEYVDMSDLLRTTWRWRGGGR